MNISFYSAAVGAGGYQAKIDVLANNIANVNTNAYKEKRPVFSDLLHNNINAPAGQDTNLKVGSGIRLEKTDSVFSQGGVNFTGGKYDFAIDGDGFFALMNPATNEISYTRLGRFSLSLKNDVFYLVSDDGLNVLDRNNNPIIITDTSDAASAEQFENIGIFDFMQKSGLENAGESRYTPVNKNGAPALALDSKCLKGYLETSNVELPKEYTSVIETQRAYQMALKMVQTSDEIENTINTLR